jgi:transcriptional regulator with XRE-family HTH domain
MGWTQEILSQQWSYSFETISAWERGKRKPSNQEIPRLASLLGMPAEVIVESIIRKGNDIHDNPSSLFCLSGSDEVEGIYTTRTEWNHEHSYYGLFEKAETILAVGISLNAITMNFSQHLLHRLITQQECHITLCFLDPDGRYCTEREEEEACPKETLATITRTNIRMTQALTEQIRSTAPHYQEYFQVFLYDLAPRVNIYLIDSKVMTVQYYGYGRGEESPLFLLKKVRDHGLFDYYASVASHILSRSRRSD